MPSSADRSIDLNADLGEGPGEEPLYTLITTANIACGGHAGNAETMRRAVSLALRHDVAIGAHPSYPDRGGFGRVARRLDPKELARAVAEQVAGLVQLASELGAHAAHVKPHGALYNDAADAREVAEALADGVASVSASLILVGLARSPALDLWRARGFRVAAEGFADRTYAANGRLVPRAESGALITDPAAARAQAIRLAASGDCETICVHADTPGAAAIAAAVRCGLEDSGYALRALSKREHGT